MKKLVKPSMSEIRAYCVERKSSVDPEKFYDFYESKGWKVGKNAMKHWRASVRTWERNEFGDNDSGKKSAGNRKSKLDSGEENFDW